MHMHQARIEDVDDPILDDANDERFKHHNDYSKYRTNSRSMTRHGVSQAIHVDVNCHVGGRNVNMNINNNNNSNIHQQPGDNTSTAMGEVVAMVYI